MRAFVYEDASGRHVVKISGALEVTTAEAFLATVEAVRGGSGGIAVQVDLSGVDFLDSSGIRALLRAHRAAVASGGSLTVSGARGLVAEVLRITAVGELLGMSAGDPSGDRPSVRDDGEPPPE
ncbi:hypothetical protein GCM10023322_72010 [Rugosimonospora acidiphila]|uniref:STAS domain-containing protein n=1 Tax=Rugosimonospora acidiphila TaxID=556531 RepID=A0ABP9SL87_9ACTN